MQRKKTGTSMGGSILNAKKEQRKAIKRLPKEKLYIYACKEGHQRIETVELEELPICTNCIIRLGVANRLEHIRTTDRIKQQTKQTKRNKKS